ncbi:hypothetical protein CYMTET_9538 [Cymbomonas tetramitiformis]|uniref:Uncharacterized protein n=1 Tax=Cymbomonas tetramitiformis TaxID=36881 RepID=A0AAE0GR12_9CHLO|nr:hypothetical protein CYMTET_9538 [Cymbomonas tetramitiformis]
MESGTTIQTIRLITRPDLLVQVAVFHVTVTCLSEPSRIKDKSSNSVIQIRASERVAVGVSGASDGSLSIYLKQCARFLPNFTLPLGASVVAGADWLEVSVPPLKFYDVWVQPKATTTYSVSPLGVEFLSNSATLTGSHHVESLGLSDRYDLSVRALLREEREAIDATVDVVVNVDLPMPFSLMPKPVVEPVASAVMQSMTSLFLRQVVEVLAHDFQTRSKDYV